MEEFVTGYNTTWIIIWIILIIGNGGAFYFNLKQNNKILYMNALFLFTSIVGLVFELLNIW